MKKSEFQKYIKAKGTFQVVLYGYYPRKSTQKFDKWEYFFNYLLIVDSYSKIPKLCGMDKIAIEEMRDKLHIFQSRFGKIDGFFWWDLDRISVDAGTQIYLHGAPGCMPNPQC